MRTQEVRAAGLDGRLALGHIIRPSEHPGVIYELKQNLDLKNVFGRSLRTNSHGLRGPDYHAGEHPGIFRIVTIGDSFMFGQGVDNGECTVRVMERALRKALPHVKIEVVNMGVPGYNAAMEVELLAKEGLAYEPDLVMIDFVNSDFDLPNFLSAETDFWALDRSFAYQWLRGRLRGQEGAQGPLEATPFVAGRYPHEKEEVKPEYRWMVGHDGYRDAIRRLSRLADEHSFKVVMTAHFDRQPVVDEMATECSFLFLHGWDVLKTVKGKQGMLTIEEYLRSDLVLSKDDNHPTAPGHKLVGDYYAKQLTVHWKTIWRSK